MAGWTAPITSLRPEPLDVPSLVERLRLTVLSTIYVAAAGPAIVLVTLTVVALPTALIGVGLLIALVTVPGIELLTGAHRRLSGALLGEAIRVDYADSGAANLLRPVRWARDKARWRDLGFCVFSGTVGLFLSSLPPVMLTGVVTFGLLAVFDDGPAWRALSVLSALAIPFWWIATPTLVRARALADRGLLDRSSLIRLTDRVEEVVQSRAESLDHSEAELRRIERDLHDGAQARIAAAGMNVGLAEKVLTTDPQLAAGLLREAREATSEALDDLRGVIQGILPPVLADQGLPGAVMALAVRIPVPTTVSFDVPRLPAPIESAVYFGVAECLANTVKHSNAEHAFVRGVRMDERLRVTVGDNGRGGAEPGGSGLAGISRRLAAFDGTVNVSSPIGEGTTVTMELPCPLP